MPTLPVTLVVITHDEASAIGRCLDSAPFFAGKVVGDSGSIDDIVAIAQAHAARTRCPRDFAQLDYIAGTRPAEISSASPARIRLLVQRFKDIQGSRHHAKFQDCTVEIASLPAVCRAILRF